MPEAQEAFKELKYHLYTALILQPQISFTVKVDAFSIGVGMVAQWASMDGKLHPCVYHLHHLMPAKRCPPVPRLDG